MRDSEKVSNILVNGEWFSYTTTPMLSYSESVKTS